MKIATTTNKTANKKRFLAELKGALKDIKEAEAMTGMPFVEAFQVVKNAHGGRRAGAGAKKSDIKKVQRGVKLSDPEYKFIIKKYGSFSGGVRSLLPKNMT